MSTLYVNFAEDCDSPIADAHEKVTLGATDAVTTAATTAGSGNGANYSEIELLTDTACIVSIGAAPSTADDGSFYVYPGIVKRVEHVPSGYKVAAKTA